MLNAEQVATYRCYKCKERYPASEFASLKIKRCKQCQKVYNRSKRPDHPGFVYLFKSPTGYYKIGISENWQQRLDQIRIPVVFEVEMVCAYMVPDMFDAEIELHQRFADQSVTSEWFALTPEDVDYVKSLAGGAS